MARNLTPIAKLSRREGVELHPKAVKIMARRAYGPGQHGQGRRSKPSDYSLQLREKQKVKRMYGILERQFRNYVHEAERQAGVSGENLLRLLETRLDNVVYRLGFAPSRQSARQLVTHAHITLNGKKVDIPSIKVKPKDVIAVKAGSQKNEYFKALTENLEANAIAASWLSIDSKKMTAKVTGEPTREELIEPIEEQLIIEYYSR
ncbi:30S ribosomal protein S4 [Candidatus Saccharibacteria bacterium]|nr:30S ribosomal protein S4 [Candidatus Saccharibacteria bacterium]